MNAEYITERKRLRAMSAKSRKFDLASLLLPISILVPSSYTVTSKLCTVFSFYFPPVELVISHKSASAWSRVKTCVMQEMSLWPMFRLREILYKVWSRKWVIALSSSWGSSLKVCRSVKFLKCHAQVFWCSTFLFTRFIGCADKRHGRLVTAT